MIENIYMISNTIELHENTIILDIETTGFSLNSDIICIGFIKFFNPKKLILTILISENKEEEIIILKEFINKILGIKKVITYNGENFDIVRIEYKLKNYSIPFSFKNIESFDLYKYLSKIKKYTKLQSLKLQEIEKYLEITREEDFDYNKLKDYYNIDYKEKLIFHNYNDLVNFVEVIKKIRAILHKKSIRFYKKDLFLYMINQRGYIFDFEFRLKSNNQVLSHIGEYFFNDGQYIKIEKNFLLYSIELIYDSKNHLYYFLCNNKLYPVIYKSQLIFENIIILLENKLMQIKKPDK